MNRIPVLPSLIRNVVTSRVAPYCPVARLVPVPEDCFIRFGNYASADPPLISAIKDNNLEQVQALIRQDKTLVDQSGRYNEFPLMEAVKRGNVAIVRSLLENGAEVNRIHGYDTPLVQAIRRGDLEIFNLLLQYQADFNPKIGQNGALEVAIVYHRVEMVQTLLARGVVLNPTQGKIALNEAVSVGWLDLVKQMLSMGAPVDFQREDRPTPLYLAAQLGDLGMVRTLIQAGANPNSTAERGHTPLMQALLRGNVEVATYLLQNGANLNVRTPDGTHALMMAVRSGNPEAVNLVLSRDDLNRADRSLVNQAFYEAAILNNLNAARKLLPLKPDVNYIPRGAYASSLLLLLNAQDNAVMVQLLLDTGIDVTQKNTFTGATALHAVLERPGGYGRDMKEIVRTLLERGADPNIGNASKATPLHLAASRGYVEIAKLLIAHGAKVDVQEVNGDTPLHIASALCYRDMVACLLAAGADPELKNGNGETVMNLVRMTEQYLNNFGVYVESMFMPEFITIENVRDVIQTLKAYGARDDLQESQALYKKLMETRGGYPYNW